MKISVLISIKLTVGLLLILSLNVSGQPSLFFDDFNQNPVNPVVTGGKPAVEYTIWTTVIPSSTAGGTVLIEEYATNDGMIKLLARNDKDTQSGNRTEVSAPLSVYNSPFNTTLSKNSRDLEWIFTLKQNRNSSGGTNGFNGSNTGLAVVLVADTSIWGSQQGSNAKGYAVTFLKPAGAMYCASLSRFDNGLSGYKVIIGNNAADVFSEFKTWITIKVTYSPSTNKWNLYFRDEFSTSVKGDISDPNGLKLIGSVVDSTFTKIKMSHFGFALNTPTPTVSANHNAIFVDDFTVNALDITSNQFELNTTAAGAGSIHVTPESDTYGFGSEAQLTAVPDDGYIFEKWSGDVKSFLNPATVVINSDRNVVANFIPKPQELTDKKKMIHYDEVLLKAVKAEIDLNNSYFVDAFNLLINAANTELIKVENPVTNKTQLPPSGNINDYYSLGPYFWPDPSTVNGLPWIWKDGQINPLTRGDNTDQVRLSDFLNSMEILSLAYYFSDDTKYAFKAIDLLNVWLVDDSTKVNPHANYAQGVPGKADGRRTGIIEFVSVYKIIAAMQIMENRGILPETTKAGVNKWFQDWLLWLQTSSLGIEEGSSDNNHSTWYDFQVLSLLLYQGNLKDAEKLVNDFKTKRIASQIQPDGSQPKELSRTKTVNYSTMNLWAMTWVAGMARQIEVDLWNYQTTDGRSIKKAFSFLKPYVLNPSSWTLPNISNGGPVNALNTLTKPLFSKASTIFDEDILPLSENAGENLFVVDKLVFPPREQLIISNLNAVKTIPENIKVYPNPSNGLFNVQVQGQFTYSLFTLSGNLIDFEKASDPLVLDLSGYKNSFYILQIESKSEVSFIQLVKF